MYKDNEKKILALLSNEFPNRRAAFAEIINLQAILNLPKGTEHFLSDPHGEYEAFTQIINNCSGVIAEKVEMIFGESMTKGEQAKFCTLIYYPREGLKKRHDAGRIPREWYEKTLGDLIELAEFLSSKYTRSKVRKAMPEEFAFIIDELLHAKKDEDNNRARYHAKILESIIETGSADEFIIALCVLIKRLAVDRLHILGDIFDRGPHADRIMDLLMCYKNDLDIEWGNHDILWMGAACGNLPCILHCINNNVKYGNYEVLENGYGISMRSLVLFAEKTYRCNEEMDPLKKAISVLIFKSEGQLIKRHPEYEMEERLLFEKIDWDAKTVTIDGAEYRLGTDDFPTVKKEEPLAFSKEEQAVVDELIHAFSSSVRLREHVDFLYSRGSMYRKINDNLLYHGCIPLDEEGNLCGLNFFGKTLRGRAYLDMVDEVARQAWSEGDETSVDFMWYLWCGLYSPLFGRVIKTFERTYIEDESTWEEPRNPYYVYNRQEKTVNMILHEFGLYSERSHIINGHTPVHVTKGESPVRAGGKLYVIDGGFCKAYQKATGIAGYTLIFNSHGFRLKTHMPFLSIEKALEENADIHSRSQIVEEESERVMVADTDDGKKIAERIEDLNKLLLAYRSGMIREKY